MDHFETPSPGKLIDSRSLIYTGRFVRHKNAYRQQLTRKSTKNSQFSPVFLPDVSATGHEHSSGLFLKLHDLVTLSYFSLKLLDRELEPRLSLRPLKLRKTVKNLKKTKTNWQHCLKPYLFEREPFSLFLRLELFCRHLLSREFARLTLGLFWIDSALSDNPAIPTVISRKKLQIKSSLP